MADLTEQSAHANAHRFAPAAPDEEFVFGACCPGWHSAGDHTEALDDWLSFMREQDVVRVCCLLSGRQLDRTNGNVGRYRRTFGATNVRHVPVPDHHLADETTLTEEILPFLDDAVRNEERVVVHCLAGIGRTGQVLAAWLASDRGYDPETAVEVVEGMGRLPHDAVRAGNATEDELHALIDAVR